MTAVIERETTDAAEATIDPDRVIEYCEGRQHVLPEELLEHLRLARIGLRRQQREVNNLSLVQATTRRLLRLHKYVDQSLFMELMIYARFKLELRRGQLFDLNKELTESQRDTLKSMTLAGATDRGYAAGRSARK